MMARLSDQGRGHVGRRASRAGGLDDLRRAIARAREQRAVSFEIRSTVSLLTAAPELPDSIMDRSVGGSRQASARSETAATSAQRGRSLLANVEVAWRNLDDSSLKDWTRMSTLPKYIARGGEVAWIGLSGYRDVELYGFAVKADPTLVHEMWSRYIGEPSQDLGAHIDVRGTTLNHVLFVFLDSEQHQESRNPGSKGLYREQLFAIVVLGYRRQPDPGLVLFAPYLCASDTPGWKADREIYGYPREHGSVRIDRDRREHRQMWSVEGVSSGTSSRRRSQSEQQIFRIVRSPDAVPERPTGSKRDIARRLRQPLGRREWNPGVVARRSIVRQPRLGVTEADLAFFERFSGESAQNPPDDGPAEAFNLEQALLSGALPMLFLKQFRDIAYADRACYQAIVEAPLEVSGDIVELAARATGWNWTTSIRRLSVVSWESRRGTST